MNARTQAIATQDRQIEESAARAAAARPRQNALQKMASRLDIDPERLMTVLRSTVFQKASQDEFAALLIVSNEYGLNPLTKEIYAFPAKGGGIVPLVSIDGWIRIMNQHPQFDGYEHEDIFLDGEFVAVETTIFRKDRTRPIKVTEYLDECKRNTEPWNAMPHRMLRHKSLIQCARIAFGFSGISDEEDLIYLGGDLEPMQQARIPTDKELRRQEAANEGADQDTGEIAEELTEDQQREIDEQLDAEQSAQERGMAGDEPEEQEEAEPADDTPAWQAAYDKIVEKIDAVKTEADWRKADALFQRHAASLPEDEFKRLDETLTRVLNRIRDAK